MVVEIRKEALLLTPAIFFLCFWFFYPFIYNIYISFFDYSLYTPEINFIGIDNYVKMLQDLNFYQSLGVSFLFMAICISIEFALGLGIALLLARELRGISIFRILFTMPILFMPIGVAVMWKLQFLPMMGMIDYFFRLLGYEVPWVGHPVFSFIVITIIDAWQWTPFIVIILLAGLLSLPKEPYEAAAIDGLPPLKVFTRITLPMLKPAIAVAVILRSLDLFKLFDSIYAITLGGSGTETLSFYIYRTGFSTLNIGYSGTVSFIFWIVAFILANILVRVFKSALE